MEIFIITKVVANKIYFDLSFDFLSVLSLIFAKILMVLLLYIKIIQNIATIIS